MKSLFKKDVTHLYVASADHLKSLTPASYDYARLLKSEEVQRYSIDPVYDISAAAADAVDGKKLYCSATFNGSTLTAYTFFATGEIDAAFNSAGYGFGGTGFRLPENTLYMFKVFVLPEHRGKNKMAAAVQHGVSSLLPDGGWVVTSTDICNHAAQGMFRKLGFIRKPKISEYRLLGFGYYSMPRCLQLSGEDDSNVTTVEVYAGRFRC